MVRPRSTVICVTDRSWEMKNLSRASVVTSVLAVTSLLSVQGASAVTGYDVCSAGGDVMSAGTTYTSNGTAWYVSKHQMTITNNSRNNNNLAVRYRAQSNTPVYYAWNSGDNIKHDETYYRYPKTNGPKSQDPEMYTGVDFDQIGGDPHCYTLLPINGTTGT